MQIGEAAKVAGVSTKMIRHYESIGLVPPADRRASNYRDYDHHDLHRLAFIRRARDLGFSLEEVRELLHLWDDRQRSNADVKALALGHLQQLEGKILLLEEMRSILGTLVEGCDGDGRPDCPIINGLAMPALEQPRRSGSDSKI